MMNKLIIFACLAVTFAVGSIASAHDFQPAGWRGIPNSTFQIWEFSTENTMPIPNAVENPYGDPNLRVTPSGNWVPDPGAWPLGEIDILIPNLNRIDGEKIIQIQLTWQAANNDLFLPDEPLIGITTTPLPGEIKIHSRTDYQAGDWINSVQTIEIWPNPSQEWIAIKGDILVDELVIDTLCVPEPATICLLGLGTLTLLRKRRV